MRLLVSVLPSRSLAELMLMTLGMSFRFIAAFADPGPADADDAGQVFSFQCCVCGDWSS